MEENGESNLATCSCTIFLQPNRPQAPYILFHIQNQISKCKQTIRSTVSINYDMQQLVHNAGFKVQSEQDIHHVALLPRVEY